MNTDPTMNSNLNNDAATHSDQTEATTLLPLPEFDFRSIDRTDLDWRERFPVSMLKAARILLKNDAEVRELSPERISRVMARHRNEIPGQYTPLQIRQELYKHWGQIRGGGIKIEWNETSDTRFKSVPHYTFSISRIYREQESGLGEGNYDA